MPGIGKRTAERIIVELREKVAGGRDGRDRGHAARPTTRARSPARACSGLGFSPQEADGLLDGAEGETPEELIAAALKAAR